MSVPIGGPFLAQANGDSVDATSEPGWWSVNHAPAAATQATIAKAAVAGKRHVCKCITATLACGATAQTPITVVLRDGLTGAGPVLWAGVLSAPVNQCASIQLPGLSIVGSPNTAMTLEFTAAGVAASLEAVTLNGFDVTENAITA